MGEIPKSPDDFALAFESSFGRLRAAIARACERHAEWPAKVTAGILAALDFAADEPTAARMLTLETLVQRPGGGRRYVGLIEHFAEVLRAATPSDLRRPPSTEQALAAALAGRIAEHLRYDTLSELRDIAPELVEFVLTPYLGREEARLWCDEQLRRRDD